MQLECLDNSQVRRAWRIYILNLGKALHSLLQMEIVNWEADWVMSAVKLRYTVII